MSVIIYLNGKKEEVQENTTIAKLLEQKKIRPEVVTVELNEQIIEGNNYALTSLKPDDRLEFVFYMGGGGSTQPPLAVSLTIDESNHPERTSKASESKEKIYVYIIKCKSGFLYTGLTNNVKRRFQEHLFR